MTGGLEAKINEGFVLPRFSSTPTSWLLPRSHARIAAQIALGAHISIFV